MTVPSQIQIKPHKGRISLWLRVPISSDQGLGFYVMGVYLDHPRGVPGGWRTSYAVGFDETTQELETVNSRYTLVGPEIGTLPELIRD